MDGRLPARTSWSQVATSGTAHRTFLSRADTVRAWHSMCEILRTGTSGSSLLGGKEGSALPSLPLYGDAPVERRMSMAISNIIPDARPRPVENRLLSALSPNERQHLLPLMQTVQLKRNQTIHLSGEAIGSVYFPVTAVLALVSTLEDGRSTGLGIVGSWGMAGLPLLLGAESVPFEMVVLVPGMAHRMRGVAFGDQIGLHGPLEHMLRLYTLAFMNHLAQGMACVCHHSVRQRMATWLLMLHDALPSDQIPLTQEFLGQMLGVGRPSITLTATGLQADDLIHYHRGDISICDRAGLELAACECYQLIRDQYDHLFQRMMVVR